MTPGARADNGTTPAVELTGIVKRFARVIANDGVSFSANRGEIHAIVGENGAGKSTLMRILYGETRPDAGQIRVDGREIELRSPRDAIAAGIGMVHQHFTLVAPLTVADNVVLGHEPVRAGFHLRGRADTRVAELGAEHGMPVDPCARVDTLGVGAKQQVEILKLLHRGARVLVLDEPTAVLTPQETDGLFRALTGLSASGRTIILITHRLSEVVRVADRATVMRRGRTISTSAVSDVTIESLAHAMVGRSLPVPPRRTAPRSREMLLSLDRVSLTDSHGHTLLDDVSLGVRAGEVVGVAGVAGNGQTELVEVVSGLRAPDSGRITLGATELRGRDRGAFADAGIGLVPEDRLDEGLVSTFSVADNLVLGRHRRRPFANALLRDRAAVTREAEALVGRYDVRPPDAGAPVEELSGGNQQKVVLARALAGDPVLLVAAGPTRGVDVGAVASLHRMLAEAASDGLGVLLVSAELDELTTLSHRILVMVRGAIVAELPGEEATPEVLGEWMLGGRASVR